MLSRTYENYDTLRIVSNRNFRRSKNRRFCQFFVGFFVATILRKLRIVGYRNFRSFKNRRFLAKNRRFGRIFRRFFRRF
jgi:hypothetical protein